MKNKKPHPLLNKHLNNKPSKSHSKVAVAVILVLLVAVFGYFIWTQSQPKVSEPIDQSSSALAEQTKTTNTVASPDVSPDDIKSAVESNIDDTADDGTSRDNDTINTENNSAAMASNQIPDPKAILQAPLPQNNSLAKEEIDRLEDERQRLAEQEKLAAEQLAMNKKLADMKAEQIALLEQQIAQLEADNASKTTEQ
ncbi:MAG: hypothetical protein ACTII9_06810 [Psychrobacter celer]